ncbi:LysE family translocator [Aquiflexum gelatinilyticum]|uniref:LysE family translocator n=1 Tax=Aquiflexum gelatinilyticum TaxID=2961943 RepID=A0A9X2T0V7_9BACT|nr:LysE family translocator [Aquiflexum gelatinilyticum]MCR9014075.1 LysE family translocator [Aquiflexum gelatinilyticum]MCS4433230.1 LysE family translocator [Aquiflexum gelatinilyticum]
MSQALWEGISMGLVLSAMIGPVFFALVQKSLENGFRYAAIMALGILLSDLIYVLITYFSVSFFAQYPYFEIILGYAGGTVLIGFGISSILKKNQNRPNTGGIPLPKAKKRNGFMKGFGINGINPFVLLFWVSIASLVNLKQEYRRIDIWFYYAGILLTVFSIDLLKSFIAKQLSGFVTPKLMFRLNILVGFILIFFGSKLVKFAWDKQVLMG